MRKTLPTAIAEPTLDQCFELDLALIQFEKACHHAQQQLAALIPTLKKRWVKRCLLSPATRIAFQRELERGMATITAVAQAAQAIRLTPQLQALRQLEAHIQQLTAEKGALQAYLPHPKKTRLFDQVISLTTPVVCMVWGLLLKLGFLSAASVWIMGLPMVFGIGILIKTTAHQLHFHFRQAKTETRLILIEQFEQIIHLFKKMEKKMHASDIWELKEAFNTYIKTFESQTQKNAAETWALRQEVEEIKETNTKLKETMEKILEVMQGKQH